MFCADFRLGSYLLLSGLTCFALDVVTGPQQVARLPDPVQLEEVRAAAEHRKSMAQLKLRRAAERAMRRKTASSLGKGPGCIYLIASPALCKSSANSTLLLAKVRVVIKVAAAAHCSALSPVFNAV